MRISMLHKSTHIIAIIGFGFCVVSLAAYVFVFRQVEQHKVSLEEVRSSYARIEQNRDTLTALVEALKDTEGDRNELKSRILTESGVIDFLTLIEDIGREQRVVLKTNTITIRPINASFETVVISVQVEGTYDALLTLLTLFEQLPYQVTIGDVQLSHTESVEGDTWQSTYDIQVTKFKTYEL
jgi:Tfp pilus assembly protein PilO